MSNSQSPIGVFDSGVGGLTVVAAIQRLLPHENIVYLGDTARVPYGNKSPETIRDYAREDAAFLLKRGVKALVIACNTATAHGLSDLRSHCPVPVLGVIEPGVDAALSATRAGRIGIIGTAGTIQSGAYQRSLLEKRPDLQITALATPLLVPLVEENWLQHSATQLILAEYLAPLQEARIDTLVLACTHYPLLKGLLHTVLKDEVALVDSAENMATALAATLTQHGLANPSDTPGSTQLYVTDLSPQFSNLAWRFLRAPVDRLEKISLG
jgi:glutamate racemase